MTSGLISIFANLSCYLVSLLRCYMKLESSKSTLCCLLGFGCNYLTFSKADFAPVKRFLRAIWYSLVPFIASLGTNCIYGDYARLLLCLKSGVSQSIESDSSPLMLSLPLRLRWEWSFLMGLGSGDTLSSTSCLESSRKRQVPTLGSISDLYQVALSGFYLCWSEL